jgi:DNA-binding transcriptional ArsR family regulator
MKSSYAFAALVGFALLNTGFLGVYLLSSTGDMGALSSATYGLSGTISASSTSTVSAVTSTATSTLTSAVQSAASNETYSTTTTVTGLSTSAVTFGPTATDTVTQPLSTSTNGTGNLASGVEGGLTAGPVSQPSAAQPLRSVYQFLEIHSLALAPGSWLLVGGMWIWRGRMRSRWTDFGFDSDVFGLFVKMKGGKTRIRLLDALSLPKDRLQLAQELGLDWKGVDRHLVLLKKYGFVDDKIAYGKVRMYELTPLGVSLLRLLQELSREERRESAFNSPMEQDWNPQA